MPNASRTPHNSATIISIPGSIGNRSINISHTNTAGGRTSANANTISPSCSSTTTISSYSRRASPPADESGYDTSCQSPSSAVPQPAQCRNCSSTNIIEDEDETICGSCGLVIDDAPTLTAAGGHNDANYGLTRVNNIGRSYEKSTGRRLGYGASITTPSERRIQRQSEREATVQESIKALAARNGLDSLVANNAFSYWRKYRKELDLRYTRFVCQTSVACLYIAAREKGQGVSLVKLAMYAEMSPYTLGSMYTKVKEILLKNNIITREATRFNTEEDPWIALQRIYDLGSERSIQSGEMDTLSPLIQSAFGIHESDKKRIECQRRILNMAQKCMIVAIDSGLSTGRQLLPLVAASVAIAVEVHLKLTKCPDELLQFVSHAWLAAKNTVKRRYNELLRCLTSWAKRLPFIDIDDLKRKKLCYYIDDVFKYFGTLKDKDRQLWAALDDVEADQNVTMDEEDEEDEFEYEDGQAVPERLDDTHSNDQNVTVDEKDDSGERESEGDRTTSEPLNGETCSNQEKDSESRPTIKVAKIELNSNKLYPPSYRVSAKRHNTILGHILAAKGLTDAPTPNPKPRRASIDHVLNIQRGDMVKRLVELGTRTKQELLCASDNDLIYWIESDAAKVSGRADPRSSSELDSVELTEADVSDNDLGKYLKTKEEMLMHWKIMGQTYLEHEAEVKAKAEVVAAKTNKRLKEQETGPKRSKKLRYEALSDQEEQEQEEEEEEEEGEGEEEVQEDMEDEEEENEKKLVEEGDEWMEKEEEEEEEEW
ncbi:hypothetical protein BGX28_008413 [Mortierella sp. GBA30]|nr:hypothetical protein BGX28_008413 [Mortierella sp. GBA30]